MSGRWYGRMTIAGPHPSAVCSPVYGGSDRLRASLSQPRTCPFVWPCFSLLTVKFAPIRGKRRREALLRRPPPKPLRSSALAQKLVHHHLPCLAWLSPRAPWSSVYV